jgi:phytoene dehydrogenase-like protein
MVDAVVIGAGHNGLVAANLLADAGWRVQVLEATAQAGGSVRTAELTAPGFHCDVFSAFFALGVASPVLRRLGLEEYGLEWVHAPLVVAHPQAHGGCAALSRDLAETAASLEAFAPGDGAAWERLYGRWRRLRGPVLAGLFSLFPPVKAGLALATRMPTRSPSGTEALWAYAHVPQKVRGDAGGSLTGAWTDAEAEAFADRIEARIEARAPGFRDRIRARHVMGPPRMQELNPSLVHGALNVGTAQLYQQLLFRPTPAMGRPTTPIRNVYLASGSAHPGGGVHGAPGANAATLAIRRDRRRRLASPAGGWETARRPD